MFKLKIANIFQWNWLEISRFLMKVFLITFPFQLEIIIYKSNFFSGQFNSFAASFLAVNEMIFWLVGICLAISWLKDAGKTNQFKFFKNSSLWLICLLLVALLIDFSGVFFAKDQVLVLLMSFKQLQLFLLLLLLKNEGLLSLEEILKSLLCGGCLQAMIGLTQFVFQSSLGLKWLGESSLSTTILNVAKVDLPGGSKLLRAYGTFSHANILGGFMFLNIAVYMVLFKEKFWRFLPVLLLLLIGLLVSFSRTAWLATAVFFIVESLWNKKKFNWKIFLLMGFLLICILIIFNWQTAIWIRLTDFNGSAWQERLLFLDLAKNLIGKNPLGVGLANFVLEMGNALQVENLAPWMYQPVHNFFLLATAETGWLGGFLWLTIFIGLGKEVYYAENSWKKGLFAGVVVLSMLDHYLWTAWPGQIILIIFLYLLSLKFPREVLTD